MRRVILLAVVLVTACAHDELTGPDRAAFSISDGSHAGNEHFFFLSPMVKNASYSGTFDAGLAPTVHICVLDGDACDEDVATFTMTDGVGSEVVRMELSAEHYVVNWHTRGALGGAGINTTDTYRIRVLVDGAELGFADVRAANGKAKKDVDGNEHVVIQPGQTLAIQFRIEEGLVSEGSENRRGIAVSAFHSCALDGEGAAWCWGSGFSGQLGNGVFGDAMSPVAVQGGHRFAMLAVGGFHTCGLKDDGSAWCWGGNTQGALGIGTVGGFVTAPVAAAGAPPLAQIVAGQHFTCGLTDTGAAYCWGGGSVGQIGDGTTTAMQPVPTPVAGSHVFTTIDAGAGHVCALDETGAAWCWGENSLGQIGDGSTATIYPFIGATTPNAVVGGLTFDAISAGVGHSCALSAGAAYCWGAGYEGQVGDGTLEFVRYAPTAVLDGHTFFSIDAAASQTCAVDDAGAGWCWGGNRFGQIGTGDLIAATYTLPAAVIGAHTWTAITGGTRHTCGLTTDGEALCWGRGGALGDGSDVTSAVPVMVGM